MIHGLLGRLLAVLALATTLATGAAAQNYDGNGLVKFGFFGAGEFYDVKGGGSTSLDGAALGVSAGYDLIFDQRLLLGIEADLQVGDTLDRLSNGIKAHADFMASLRGRLGVFLGPQFMIYGTGGIAWAGLGIENTLAGGTGGDIDTNKTMTGWIYGGGMEFDVGTVAGFGTLIFAEYLAASFDTWRNPPGLPFDLDTDVQTFRIGVKLKVGHDYHEERRRHEPLK